MSGLGFYDEYLKLMGNLKDKPDLATIYKIEYIDLIVNYLTEMYDVYSLTYMYQDDMWQYYAANGNGICVEFEVGDYDYLYPVEYCDKLKIDFTRMVVSALKQSGMELSIIPWVVKNPYNQTADMDSTKEKEVRMLYCPYDLAEFNGGTIAYNIKERKGYKGIAKPYEDFKLKIAKVIIGDKCRVEHVSELQKYFDVRGINYIRRGKA